ncbi:hypothetical protein CCP3SC5AM1_2760001 [Gammaproteobacteria bacterium]
MAKTGTGSGTVTSNPSGINCGSDCNEYYVPNTKVTLTVIAASGSVFAGWSGGGCTGIATTCVVTVNSAMTVTATFNKIYSLIMVKAGTGTGTVTSNPSGINCGTDCNENYVPNTKVTLTATPSSISSFSGWSGGCSGTAAACTITMTANKTVTATFIQKPMPNFVITSITLNPTTPTAKSTFSALVTVKNQGTLAGNGGYLDVWPNKTTSSVCGDDGDAWTTVGTLTAGQSKTFTIVNLRSGAVGSKTFRAFVDSWCETHELNESNNQLTKSFTVN